MVSMSISDIKQIPERVSKFEIIISKQQHTGERQEVSESETNGVGKVGRSGSVGIGGRGLGLEENFILFFLDDSPVRN